MQKAEPLNLTTAAEQVAEIESLIKAFQQAQTKYAEAEERLGGFPLAVRRLRDGLNQHWTNNRLYAGFADPVQRGECDKLMQRVDVLCKSLHCEGYGPLPNVAQPCQVERFKG